MHKIAVGKIGQRIIFDRKSKEADRSNTNGNYGVYKTLKMMFELNPQNEYVIVGSTDYDTIGAEQWSNVKTYNMMLDKGDIDYGIFIPGIKGRDPYDDIIAFLNESNIRWIMLTMDPRTTHQFEQELVNKPKLIMSQTQDDESVYVPLHLAEAYGVELAAVDFNSRKGMICILNETEDYDRVGDMLKLTSKVDNVVYAGRWTKNSHKNYIGEIKFDDAMKLEKTSLCSMIAPIKPGWITSKYIEMLANGAMPFVCNSYGAGMGLDFGIFDCTEKSPDYVKDLYEMISRYKNMYEAAVGFYRKLFGVYEAIKGEELNAIINKEVQECLML